MLDNLPDHVKVVEVGPRDGLQNEAHLVPAADKVRLIEALAGAGLSHIEITSFVSPKWIPQMGDAETVAAAVNVLPGLHTSALVPNAKGYEAARRCQMKEIAVFMSATETHSKKNINKSIAEAMTAVAEVVDLAKADGVRVRGYLSVVFACPYEGKTNPEAVMKLSNQLFELGIDELSLGDTIGAATPRDVVTMLNLLSSDAERKRIALHFHDTRGTALANVVAGLESGITTFDASIGGMGGCPYAPGAAGNLATEDLVYMLHGMGIKTGINLDRLIECGRLAQEIVSRPLPGRYLQACLAMQEKQSQQKTKAEATS